MKTAAWTIAIISAIAGMANAQTASAPTIPIPSCPTTPPTTGTKQICYDTSGAVWTCVGTCAVSGDWVAASGSGSFSSLTGHATSTATGGATDVYPFYDVTVLPSAATAVAGRVYRMRAATTKDVCLTAGDSGGSAVAVCVVNYAGTAYNVINSDLIIGTAAAHAAGDFEPAAGNPSVNGYVWSSTIGGLRSWVPQTGGGISAYNVLSYNFPQYSCSGTGTITCAPGGSSTANLSPGTVTLTLTPVPWGVNGSLYIPASPHALYLFIDDSVGGNSEAVPIVSGGTATGGASTGTIEVVLSKSHTAGNYFIHSASYGAQETVQDAMAHGGQGTIYFPGYVPSVTYYAFWAPVYAGRNFTFTGDGFNSAIVGVNSAMQGLFDIESGASIGGSVRFEKLQISSYSQQTSGGYGVRIGYNAESSNVIFDGVYFNQMYDGILCINCNQLHVDNSTFYQFGHTAITAADPLAPDDGGPRISNSVFLNYSISPAAEAAILTTSSAEHMLSNNTLDGGQMVKWLFEYNSTTSGGWINIANNKCEDTTLGCISLTGYGAQTAITGNTMAPHYSNTGSWDAISVNGSGGSGFVWGTITGNTIQGASSSNSNRAIFFQGTTSDWTISGNSVQGVNYGYNINGSPTGVTVQLGNTRTTYSSPVFCAASGVTAEGGSMYYSQMVSTVSGSGNCSNGSRTFCIDCNSTCTGGSSTGRSCVKENGVWTH